MAVRVRCFGLQSFFACVAVAVSIGAVSVVAHATVVTQEIDAEVLSVSGENASFFAGADRVVGSLRYDDAVPDSNPDPSTGTYTGALVSLTATVPALGFGWSADAGGLGAFPDMSSGGDQLTADSFANNPTGAPIDGYTIRSLGVMFFGDYRNLLASDALPGPGVRYGYGNLFLAFQDDFGRIKAQTLIVFAPEPECSAAALAAFAGLVLTRARRGRSSASSSGATSMVE